MMLLQPQSSPAGSDARSDDAVGIRGVVKKGLLTVGLGFGLFMLWALFVPLSEGVVATGEIIVDGQRKSIQHLEGGIVREIKVREGDIVERGQPVLVLDATRNRAEYDLLLTRYHIALATLDRFRAERDGLEAIIFSEELQQQADSPKVAELIKVQENLIQARRVQLEGQVSILENQIDQLRNQITGLEAERTSIRTQISLLKQEVERIDGLYKQNLTELSRLNQQKITLSEAEGALGDVSARIAAATVQIGEAQLQILQLENSRQQEIAEGILAAQELKFEVREQLASAESVLDRTVIRSPIAGQVLGLNVFTSGGVVPPGETLMQIVPVEKVLIVNARVRPVDIDTVQTGMIARVRLSALNARTTPELRGEVVGVAADVLVDEASQEPFYLVRVAVPEKTLNSIKSGKVVPGMPVELLIEGGTRTAMQYLLEPIQETMRRSLRED